MQRLDSYIREVQKQSIVYMPYLSLGDPSIEKSLEFALTMIDAGAHMLELGIPFSDPTADGPIIQAAMDRSLNNKDSGIENIFALCAKIHKTHPHIPLIFLSYLNPILNALQPLSALMKKSDKDSYRMALSRNLELFLGRCAKNGVRALVIPDLPFDQEEAQLLSAMAKQHGLSQILMVSPNTSPTRLEKIAKHARGWIYYVSSLGVTGIRKEIPFNVKEKICNIQKLSGLPVLAGFGFHQADQIKLIKNIVDGVIVGSMNHRIIERQKGSAKEELYLFTKELAQACRYDTKA